MVVDVHRRDRGNVIFLGRYEADFINCWHNENEHSMNSGATVHQRSRLVLKILSRETVKTGVAILDQERVKTGVAILDQERVKTGVAILVLPR